MENQSLQRVEQGALQTSQSASYGIQEVVAQKRLVNELLKTVMKKDVHYGTIPGCGDKYALLKPGAESIGFTFRLAPEYAITKRELPNEHCEIQVVCTLRNISTGQVWGQGIGICTSMENKYRFQTKPTGKAVPEEYWRTRDKELLGGPQYATKKIGGHYQIVETIETENPMDKNNTFLKIAKKRAHVDAILTATAASDIFMNDEEMEDEDTGTMPTESESPQNAPSDNSTPRGASRNQTPPKGNPEPKNAGSENVGRQEGSSGWENAVIGFGKNAGTRLGDLSENQLKWYANPMDSEDGMKPRANDIKAQLLQKAARQGLKDYEQAAKDQASEREDNVP